MQPKDRPTTTKISLDRLRNITRPRKPLERQVVNPAQRNDSEAPG
jgi:hypothetical protein